MSGMVQSVSGMNTVAYHMWDLVLVSLYYMIGFAETCGAPDSSMSTSANRPAPRLKAAVPGGRVNPAESTMLSCAPSPTSREVRVTQGSS